MTKFLNLPIRTQLTLLATLLTLPALGIVIYSGLRGRAIEYQDAIIESQKLADNLSAQQEIFVRESKLTCALLAGLPDVKNHNISKVQAILASILKENPAYINILISDAKGDVWASAVPLNKAYSVADRRYFKNARETLQFSSGEYVVGMATNKPTIHMAYPILNRGEFQGVVIVGFNLEAMRTILERAQLNQDANYIFVDHKGIILSRGKDPALLVGTPLLPDALKRMEQGHDRESYLIVRKKDGDRRITTVRKLWLPGEQRPYMYVRAGISEKDVLGKANRDLIVNVSLLLVFVSTAFIFVLFIGKRSVVDRVILLKQASQRLANGNLDSNVSKHVSGGELGSLAQTFDVMANQVALREQALREKEKNYRDIFNATHDALFVYDAASGEIIEVNKTAEKIFGFKHGEILQDTLPKLSLEESTSQTLEWLSKRKNGESFWTEVVLSVTSIVGKKCVLAVVRDITERKEMGRMKDEMISAVSHEMRTPLTAMLGYIQFIMENKLDVVTTREYLGVVHKETLRLKELISNFLDMQRLQAKQGIHNFKRLDIRSLLEEAATLFSNASDKHRISLDVITELPLVFGNEEDLRTVADNLLSNAVKYSPSGGNIILGARQECSNVTLWVKDEGVGIPLAEQDKIFSRFYRVDNTARRITNGTGLGLSLVKEIVHAHNGCVWVESTLGMGSIFYVTLPVVTDIHNTVKEYSSYGTGNAAAGRAGTSGAV